LGEVFNFGLDMWLFVLVGEVVNVVASFWGRDSVVEVDEVMHVHEVLLLFLDS